MKRTFLVLLVLFQLNAISQIIYSERFGSSALQSYTASNGTGAYTLVPSGYSVINDGHNNNIGSNINANTPFNYSGLKKQGWVVGYNANVNDTFLVSTSWLDTNTHNVERWVITPPISITSANTVLRWSAMSPDNNYRDGYEVYTTTVTSGALTLNDFPIGNRVFALADGNTAGGGENSEWTNRSVNLDSYGGKTVRFAFRNNSKDRYQLWLDDIQVVTVPAAIDVAVTDVQVTKYNLINTPDSVHVSFTNNGAATVRNLVLNYTYDNSGIQSQVFSSTLGWGNSSVNKVVFPMTYNFSSPGRYKVKAWVSSVNNLSDQNNVNDTASFYTSIQSSPVSKTCLIEQFVSANNGDSPDAQERTRSIQSTTNTVISVNIHANDSMELASMNVFMSDYKKASSTALFDRSYFSDVKSVAVAKSFYTAKTNKRLAAVTPVSVSIINKSYNSSTKLLSFTVKADFVSAVAGDFRINAYLTENNVYGKVSDTTINGFNQLNDYYSVPWSPYYQQGYYSSTANTHVLNAWLFKHQNVLVHAFDGAYGTNGVIPTTAITSGQSFTQTFSLTVPSSTNGAAIYNSDNLYIVAFVAEGSTDKNKRTVLNSVKEKLTSNAEVIGVEERMLDLAEGLQIYPNPSNGVVNLQLNKQQINKNLSLNIVDVLGRSVYTANLYTKTPLNAFDLSKLSNGAYFLIIDSEGKKTSKKLIIQH